MHFWAALILVFAVVHCARADRCTSDQCAAANCTTSSNYICTNGSLTNQCFFENPATAWGEIPTFLAELCNNWCDATNCTTTHTGDGCDIDCPLQWCSSSWQCDHDSGENNYMCLYGDAVGGCNSDTNFWPASVNELPNCASCCNTHSCRNTCGIPCIAAQCTAGKECNATNPFYCGSGPLRGQCLSEAESVNCTSCCDTTTCNRQNFTCSQPCTQEQCQTGARCLDGTPFMCTEGLARGGCTAVPEFWPNAFNCDACCDAASCDFTCDTPCDATACDAPCAENRPDGDWYVCSSGPHADMCTPVANQFGTSDPKCFSCCNATVCAR